MYETALMDLAVTAREDAAQSFTEVIKAVHNVTQVAENTAGTLVQEDFDDTQSKQKLSSKSIFKSLSDSKSEVIHALADLGVLMKAGVKVIVKSFLIK